MEGRVVSRPPGFLLRKVVGLALERVVIDRCKSVRNLMRAEFHLGHLVELPQTVQVALTPPARTVLSQTGPEYKRD